MAKAKKEVDDSDLEDLLGSEREKSSVEETPLDLDDLTKGPVDVPTTPTRHRTKLSTSNLCSYPTAICTYLCYVYPRLCTLFAIASIAAMLIALVNVLFNRTETFGVIENDYTNINSEYDLSLGKIDHWCLKGDDVSCRCDDPLEPTSRAEFKPWVNAHHENKKLVEAYRDSEYLDVCFLGESLFEELDGHFMGREQGDDLKGIAKSFRKHFKRENSGMEGVALGIAGDTSPNVLWRLLHGEMPVDFNPRVWWVSLGMNDLGRMQCSEEVVVLGLLRVVEEIRTRKPDAEIVINSMLPMADLRGGLYPHLSDYKDAFGKKYRGRPQINTTNDPRLRAGGKIAGGAGGGAKIMYSRPASTTEALRDRLNTRQKAQIEMLRARGDVSNSPKYPGERPPSAGMPGKKKPPKRVLRALDGLKSHANARSLRKKKMDKETAEDSTGEESKAEKKYRAKYLKKIKKDPTNLKLDHTKNKIKSRNPRTVFLSETKKLPLWASIHAINDQLRTFCDKHEKIHFFDATPIFAEKDGGTTYVLQTEKISIRGHPTEQGFQEWQDAMAKKLKVLLEKDDQKLEGELKAKKAVAPRAPDDDVVGDDSVFGVDNDDKFADVDGEVKSVDDPEMDSP